MMTLEWSISVLILIITVFACGYAMVYDHQKNRNNRPYLVNKAAI